MTEHLWYFAPITVFLAVLAYGSGKRVAAALLVLLALYLGIIDLPGHSKAARIEMFTDLDGAAINYFEGSESDGEIRIVTGRKWYRLPWSERTARALHEASRQAENEGGSFVLREPQDGTPGGEWSAEHRPAEPGPPKT